MKYILLLITLVFIACVSSKLTQSANINADEKLSNGLYNYKVYKIDSINTYYLIYAKKGDSLYKIVSKKTLNKNCEKIQRNISYAFKLRSGLTDFHIGGVLVSSKQLPHVNCYTYDDSTKICLERDSINDLYHADNIQGLCYIKW
ncbi:hypothetical protein FBD94_14725 [Pedobacter hiemivivus]|uniref:Lipoprotein n=1 Tax=Pedobacter hiemivivus TaxID=2530454 RepID=A0A4U1G8K4_9SPHI|nr:hypothetical protein [Pedobacter hiemivivus]TKC60165.1 hypothetical protein FBD94_14725 [Pedobacter hiemivivus]